MTEQARDETRRGLLRCAAGQVMMLAGAAILNRPAAWAMALFPFPVAAFILLRHRVRTRTNPGPATPGEQR